MKKNGFTLAELLGVIVILALLMLLVFPSIINQLKEGERQISSAVESLIFNGAESYIADHEDLYPVIDTTYCLTLKKLVDSNDLKESLLIDSKGKTLNLNGKVEVKIKDGKKSYKMNDKCVEG